MPMRNIFRQVCAITALCLMSALAPALVNPSLQPKDIAERYRLIVAGVINGIDESKRALTIAKLNLIKGTEVPVQVVLSMPAPGAGAPPGTKDPIELMQVGDPVVFYLGKTRAGKENEGLFYHRDEWHDINATDVKTGQWTWQRGLGDQMWGTFNGDPEQLAAMMTDAGAGRFFFPAIPFARFQTERILGSWPGELRGVAALDLDGDGRLDLVVASPTGCHAFVQTGPLVFSERTTELGLVGLNGQSISAADVDGEGTADLLVGGRLLLRKGTGFVASQRLPDLGQVTVACFAELNGDGWPDVLVASPDKGLRAFRNPGSTGDFTEATVATGLDKPECGAGLDGLVALGDWNGDGRTDLFYAAKRGFLLVQDDTGVFQRKPLVADVSFRLNDGSGRAALTGGCSFAALWNPAGVDLVVPGDSGLNLLNNHNGSDVDRARVGNEIHLSRSAQIAVLAEDLNLDGNIDLYTLTRNANSRNAFYTNRGYGSYMMDDLYTSEDTFPGSSYQTGQWGALAADLDDDGAPDLVLGGVDGKLRVLGNDVLRHRAAADNAQAQQRILAGTAIVALDTAPGFAVVGTCVTVRLADGRVAGWRRFGDQVLSGCGPAHQARIAVREAGAVSVEVRWGDGRKQVLPLTLEPGKLSRLQLRR